MQMIKLTVGYNDIFLPRNPETAAAVSIILRDAEGAEYNYKTGQYEPRKYPDLKIECVVFPDPQPEQLPELDLNDATPEEII